MRSVAKADELQVVENFASIFLINISKLLEFFFFFFKFETINLSAFLTIDRFRFIKIELGGEA